MARTIDNLGVESSNRYAEDREQYDKSLLPMTGFVPSQTKITSTYPIYPSEFDLLFELGKVGASWGIFQPPSLYRSMRRPLFSGQLIPDLGPVDSYEGKMEKLRALANREREARNPEEGEQVGKEQETLLKLLSSLILHDQLGIDINSRRAQYHKG